MNKPDENFTVIAPKYSSESELDRFAKLFHQDFDIMDCDPDEMAFGFFRSLSIQELISLRNDLAELLSEYTGKKQKGLRNAWFRHGAQWWDKKIDLREAIERWNARIDQDLAEK